MDSVERLVRGELERAFSKFYPVVDMETFGAMVKTCVRKQCVYLCCEQCNKPFSMENVRTKAGWRETQISGWCETCFDAMFSEDEEQADQDDIDNGEWN